VWWAVGGGWWAVGGGRWVVGGGWWMVDVESHVFIHTYSFVASLTFLSLPPYFLTTR